MTNPEGWLSPIPSSGAEELRVSPEMTQCHLTLAESFGLDPETPFCDKFLSFQLCAQLLSMGLRVGFCGPEDLPWDPRQSSKIL